jgi:hypothetical protein
MTFVNPQLELVNRPSGIADTGSSLCQAKASSRTPRLIQEIVPVPLRTEHISDIAQLHFRELSWSLNGHFGQGHIRDLYQALAESPHFFGYVYYAKGELIGFVTGTTDFEDTRNRIMPVYRRKMGTILRILLRNPRFLVAALESRFIVPAAFRSLGTRAEWLTFITDTRKGYIAPFVALRLIDSVRNHFRELGVSGYVAQGYKINPKAMTLYGKLRWRVAKRLVMHVVYHYPTDPT